MDCPFSDIEPGARLLENDLVVAFYNHFPVSPGHVLLVTRRHVPTWFEASDEEPVARRCAGPREPCGRALGSLGTG